MSLGPNIAYNLKKDTRYWLFHADIPGMLRITAFWQDVQDVS